jgi:hypothetical protein
MRISQGLPIASKRPTRQSCPASTEIARAESRALNSYLEKW